MDVLNLSKNEKKYYEYRARERALKDKVSFINAAKREGLSEGIKQGIDQGISQGRTDIIKSALETGKTPETVAEFIGIPLEEVLRVQNELQNCVNENYLLMLIKTAGFTWKPAILIIRDISIAKMPVYFNI